MIPKTLHYVWVGGKAMPNKVKSLLEENAKILGKGWKTKIWTEKDFDIESHPFTSYWHKKGNWAYVSDYIRAYAVYTEGGFYIDTDVELKKTLTPLCKNDLVLSYTGNAWITASTFGAEKGNQVIGDYLKVYDNKYVKKHQHRIMSTNVMSFVAEKHNALDKVLDAKYLQLDIDGTGYAIHHHYENWKGKKTDPTATKYYTNKVLKYNIPAAAEKERNSVIRKNKFIARKVEKQWSI